MYEHRTEPLLPRRQFLRRFAMHGLTAAAVVAVWLCLGILGYHFMARTLVDRRAAQRIDDPDRGGLIAGILAAPVAHRLLHRLHLAEEDDGAGGGDEGTTGIDLARPRVTRISVAIGPRNDSSGFSNLARTVH